MTSMRPAILSIGAGRQQMPLLRAARAEGVAVVAVDRAPGPEALAVLDHAVVLSTYEAEAVAQEVVALRDRFDFAGVVARTSGPPLMTAARAAQALGIDGVPLALAEAAVRKSEARSQAVALGLAVPRSRTCWEMPVLDSGCAWVLKPDVPVFGKRNVCLVPVGGDAAAAFAAAAGESTDHAVEIQEYVPGIDVGLGVLMAENRVVWSFLYDELVAVRDGRFSGLAVSGPSVVEGTATAKTIRDGAERLLLRWGVRRGFLFFSFRVADDGRALLYEVNPDLGGDALADGLLPALWPDFDPFLADIRAVTGGMVSSPGEPKGCFVASAAGVVAGEDAAAQMAETTGEHDLARRLRWWRGRR